MRVRDPRGGIWRVSRRWTPWRRWARVPRIPDTPIGWGDDALTGLIVLVVALPTLVMAAVAVAELALLVLLVPVLALGRVVLGRHWVVEVRSGWRPVWETEVGTWPQTRRAITSMASALEQGICPWEEQPGQPLEDVDAVSRAGKHRQAVRPAPRPSPRRPGAPGPPPVPGSAGPGT